MSDLLLKPCPFCGSTDLNYGICGGTLKGLDYVECENCGATVNAIHKGNYIAAEKAWNNRVSDVQEVKHGEWCFSPFNPEDAYCTHCQFSVDTTVDDIEKYKYCPNCGAKME